MFSQWEEVTRRRHDSNRSVVKTSIPTAIQTQIAASGSANAASAAAAAGHIIGTGELTPEGGGGLPRRSQSLLDLGVALQQRDKSLPPTIIEGEERSPLSPTSLLQTEECKESPKRRIPLDCESLSEVQAYTLLNAQANVQDIQSWMNEWTNV